EVGEGLGRAGEPPLADSRPRPDPLVRRVDPLRQLLVRDDVLRRMGAEPGDRDGLPVGAADHLAAKVSVPRTASSPPTRAVARPRPTGPRTFSSSQVRISSSPGSTM